MASRPDHRADLRLANQRAIHHRAAFIPIDGAPSRGLRHMEFNSISRSDRLAELSLVDRDEIDALRALDGALRVHRDDARRLRHRLDHQHPRHHRRQWKMPLKLRLVDRHILYADARFVAANIDDAIDQQEWIAVRQIVEDADNIQGFERRARDGIIREGYEGVLHAPPGIKPRPFEVTLETPQHAPHFLQEAALAVALCKILDEYRQFIAYAQNL